MNPKQEARQEAEELKALKAGDFYNVSNIEAEIKQLSDGFHPPTDRKQLKVWLQLSRSPTVPDCSHTVLDTAAQCARHVIKPGIWGLLEEISVSKTSMFIEPSLLPSVPLNPCIG